MYFEGFIKQYGVGFLQKETPAHLRRKANILFKDIAFGNITDKYYGYFGNKDFLDMIYSEAYNLSNEYWIHKTAIECMMEKYTPDDRIKVLYMKDCDKYTIYSIICQGFFNMSQCIQVEAIKGHILWMNRMLIPYKYKI